ncbi:MAG TPA: septum formation initiator family protein, partial [Microbacteriaceae bacterium]
MPEQKVPVKVNETSWWFQNLHLSGSIALFLLVVTFGVITLAPDIQLLLRQRAEIVEVEQSIELSKQSLEDMQSERDRWQDPAYIRSQARERLYYVLPGEVSYLVMDAEGIDFSSETG